MSLKRFFLILFIVLLFSCTKESFTLHSTRLIRNIEIDGDRRSENIVIEAEIEEKDGENGRYTYLLTSPDGDLRWDGELEKSGGCCISDELYITPLALFDEGEYTLYIYSDGGTSESVSVSLQKEEGNYSYDNAVKKDDADVHYYDSDRKMVENPSDAAYVEVTYTDRYSNRIKLRTEKREEPGSSLSST